MIKYLLLVLIFIFTVKAFNLIIEPGNEFCFKSKQLYSHFIINDEVDCINQTKTEEIDLIDYPLKCIKNIGENNCSYIIKYGGYKLILNNKIL